MTSDAPAPRRILLAFEDSYQTQAVLSEAVTLAAELQAELAALLVEDEDLLRLAALPFASEVLRGSGLERPLDQPTVARQLGRRAEHMRRLLEETAAARQVRTTMNVVRGRLAIGAIEALGSAEVILMAARTARVIASVRPRRQARGPINVYLDGSDAAVRALALAERLAVQQGAETVVVTSAATPETAESARSRAHIGPGGRGRPLRVVAVADNSLEQIAAAARAENARVLVLPLPVYQGADATAAVPQAGAMMLARVR